MREDAKLLQTSMKGNGPSFKTGRESALSGEGEARRVRGEPVALKTSTRKSGIGSSQKRARRLAGSEGGCRNEAHVRRENAGELRKAPRWIAVSLRSVTSALTLDMQRRARAHQQSSEDRSLNGLPGLARYLKNGHARAAEKRARRAEERRAKGRE